MAEKVLVVDRDRLFPVGEAVPQGFEPGDGQPYLARIDRWGRFVPRDAAESDPSRKQIIPYGVVLCAESVFLLRRRRGGGERRLHDLFSLGVGGHINPEDASGDRDASILFRAFRRELDEELIVETPCGLEIAGVLNDETNEVGQVHFGVVIRVGLDTPSVRVREVDQLEGKFVPASELRDREDAMETWSRFLLPHFWPAVPHR